MADEKQHKAHSQKRLTWTNRITEMYTIAVNAKTKPDTHLDFKTRYASLEEMYDNFNTTHNNVVSVVDDDDFKSEDAIRKQVDTYYFSIKSTYNELFSNVPTHSPQVFAPSPSRSRSNLPTLNLPKFNGNLKMWPTFFDCFRNTVHDDPDISPVEKFRHLLSLLEDEPFNLVKSLPLSDANYRTAYDMLVKRYQNKRIIATHALNCILTFNLKSNSNAKDLRKLLDNFSEGLSILKNLGFHVDKLSDFLLLNTLLQKLEERIRTEFEVAVTKKEIPSVDDLLKFLETHCKALESVQDLATAKPSMSFKPPLQPPKRPSYAHSYTPKNSCSSFTNVIPSTQSCVLCKGSHSLTRCPSFASKAPPERFAFVKQANLCLNCLSSSHLLKKCPSNYRCRSCNYSHHTLLHLPRQGTPSSSRDPPDNSQSSSGDNSQCDGISANAVSYDTNCDNTTVLLGTAMVDIQDATGHYLPIRILIDSASQASFISEKCIRQLGLSRRRFNVPILGLNQMRSQTSNGMTHCRIKPQNLSSPVFSFEAIVLPILCTDMPSIPLNTSRWNHIKHLNLADKTCEVPGPIDVLIGAELVPQILLSGRIPGTNGQPSALETIFGWILIGKVQNSSNNALAISSYCTSIDLDTCLRRFWEIDNITPCSLPASPDDEDCENNFSKSTYRDNTGRFTVSLPFKRTAPDLGHSYSFAYRSFLSLKRRLAKNTELRLMYVDFMRDYLDTNHMSLAPETENKVGKYYIPHHSVLKPDSSTTKLRVVFNASNPTSTGLSLNDALLPGPKLQKDIATILLSFRIHNIVFMADIKQMYRQILLDPSQRDFQRILWRFSPEEPLCEYILNTLVYGIKSSAYLALRTLKELAIRESRDFPEASRIVQNEIYVDDIISGSHSVQSSLRLQRDLIALLKRGGFELRKWASNHAALLSQLPDSDRQMSLSFDKDEPTFIKVLGLQWNPVLDTFSYNCRPLDKNCTKRSILQEIARIFDPLSFLAPVSLLAKHLMQRLWKLNLTWDETPPQAIVDEWTKLKEELPELSTFSLPRQVSPFDVARRELHGFCDASEIGYAAVAYLRVETPSGAICVNLICAKSRVAPVKPLTIPRLELSGALILSDLLAFVKTTYSPTLIIDEMFAWSDSKIVLAWLAASPSRWKTFVANRVHHIQETIPEAQWRHIRSEDNPADCASRGLMPKDFLQHTLWTRGPDWLSLPRESWGSRLDNTGLAMAAPLPEEKSIMCALSVGGNLLEINPLDKLLEKHSSLQKILRIIAYCRRFYRSNQPGDTTTNVVPSEGELHGAFLLLVKHIQRECFSDVLKIIETNKTLPKPLRKLALFVDETGHLRVGGRLKHSPLSFDQKFPVLLPRAHRLTELIIEDTHRRHLHPGLKTLHHLILQKCWILSARRAINHCISRCIICFRAKPKPYTPYMGDLPACRISQLKAFSHVFIDFCGPFYIAMSRVRGAKTLKSYACVFVCSSTKAIHFELASDLTSDAFLACLRRFAARRGRITEIWSDNGTNFKGALNQLLQIAREASESLSILWRFGPPGGPNFNGLAEAGVKSLKTHLVRVVGEQRLTYEELNTVLTQVESVLNSRPLCAQSNDPNDLLPLTPGHFLSIDPLNSVPNQDFSHHKINTLSRWQLLQKLHCDFWKRWHLEYLNSLQQRSKWTINNDSVKLNALVVIKDENRPANQWTMARVIALHPGSDGNVRVVTVKTSSGSHFKRPITKLCPLPTI